ncbi:MAG: hypothetical protein AB1813_02045, partial [Verrucomicrobiota bacterium]
TSYSEDGIHWQGKLMPDGGYVNAIAYGNGVFVAAGFRIYHSNDGIHFAAIEINPGTIHEVAFANGKFVIAGEGFLGSSLDGVSWHIVRTGGRFLSVDGNGIILVALEFGGILGNSIFTSFDGTNWRKSASILAANSVENRGRITYGHGVFVLATDREDRKHFYSFDPSLWIFNMTATGSIQMRALGVPGTRYALQVASSLDSPNWTVLRTFTPETTEGLVLSVESGTNTNLFYRLVKQ